MKILVTGAGGYIGRHLIQKIREEGHAILPVYRIGSDWGSTDLPWIETDLTNPRCVENCKELVHELMGGQPIDTVIHLAGRVDINLLPNPEGARLPPVPGPCDIGALYRDNVLATANVLQYCLKSGVKHLIFASTQAVYGMGDSECSNCGDRYDAEQEPLEHYAASKRAAEKMLEMGRKQGLAVTILRLPGIFGGDRRNGLVYNMCRDAVTKKRICVTLPYPIPMNVMHIDDVVGALVAAVGWQPPKDTLPGDMTMDISGEECSLDLLYEEIACLVPECVCVLSEILRHPFMDFDGEWAPCQLDWQPKPRKERLAQMLEEIRRGT